MTGSQRNPPWKREELILALDLYLNYKSNTKHGDERERRRLSKTLRGLHLHESIANPEKFRNVNGVSLKLSNFQHLDPSESSGSSNCSKLDRVIWDEYHDKPELVRYLTECIIAEAAHGASGFNSSESELIDSGQEYPEGSILYKMHKTRERNRKAVEAAKDKASREGRLFCSICGFDFKKTYGSLGAGFIECHHIKPIAEYKKGETTKAEDLALVCSNCHRMLHRGKVLLQPEDLKAAMNAAN